MARVAANGGLGLVLNNELAPLRGDQCKIAVESHAVGMRCRRRPRGWLVKASSTRGKKAGAAVEEQREHLKGKNAIYEEDYDGESEEDELSSYRGLVLDVTYRPVNVVCWKRAICLEFTEKADVLEYYDQTVSSPRGSFFIPAVLQVPHLLQVVKRRRVKYNLSRKSIFQRDNYTCQYCFSRDDLTIDHVLPISRGGEWKWENLVAACARCNSRKGQKTVDEAHMKLVKIPKAPKDYEIYTIPLTCSTWKTLKLRKSVPPEWQQYLPKSKS